MSTDDGRALLASVDGEVAASFTAGRSRGRSRKRTFDAILEGFQGAQRLFGKAGALEDCSDNVGHALVWRALETKPEARTLPSERTCGLCPARSASAMRQHCRLALDVTTCVFGAVCWARCTKPEEARGQRDRLRGPIPVKCRTGSCVRHVCDLCGRRGRWPLAYYKGLDRPERRSQRCCGSGVFAGMLAVSYRAIRERNPRICEAVETGNGRHREPFVGRCARSGRPLRGGDGARLPGCGGQTASAC